jgi:O-antigen/teichoic acid export membrane protein
MTIGQHMTDRSASSFPRWQPTYVISFADQALFSIGNFLLSVGLVRVYSAEEYAGYGIALSIALTLQAIQRGFTIQTSLLSCEAFAAKAGSLLATHIIILGTLSAIALAAYCLLFRISAGALGRDIAAAALACIAVFFQVDVNRIFLLKRNLQAKSLLVSTATLFAYAAVICLGYGRIATFAHSMLFLATTSVAMSALLVWRGIRPSFSKGLRELGRDIPTVFGWTTLGAIASGTYMHIPLFFLGSVQPAVQAAGYVMTRNMLQPLGVVMRSLDLVDKHTFASRVGDHVDNTRPIVLTVVRNLLVSVLIAGAIGFMAEIVLRLTYGEPATAFASALRLWVPVFIVMAMILPIETALFSRCLARPYALATAASALVALPATYALVSHFAAVGAVIASLIGYSIQAIGAVALVLWAGRDAHSGRADVPATHAIVAAKPT